MFRGGKWSEFPACRDLFLWFKNNFPLSRKLSCSKTRENIKISRFYYLCKASCMVSRAITSSSSVGITKTLTLESGVEIIISVACFLLFS